MTACKSNLKNIATALEMYSSDNLGLYPPALGTLRPNYLKIIPNCPSARADQYTPGYIRTIQPDAFSMSCSGGPNHAEANVPDADYPQYTSFQGLIERP